MSANYWTGARYHGKIKSPCTNTVNKINIKILCFDPIRFPNRHGIVCINL